ncbi:prohibitin family protein [Gallaecimonas sp. GXIMD4217]|uniref:prohibitin family protein n=1 Tax=Gallaecimonas sp. GXIMD4217 TaxID=3131927 RepID=UPI00311B3718
MNRKLPINPLAVVGGIAVLSMIYSAMYTVDEGHVGVIKRFGEAKEQVNPGLHFKIPFADRVEAIEVRTRKNVEQLPAATYEQMPVTAEVSVNWTVNKDDALSLYRAYGGLSQFEQRILDPKLRSASKDALAHYKAEQLIQNRASVINEIEALLLDAMSDYPVKLDSVQIENIVLPPRYIESIQIKQTEKNLAQAEQHKLERQRLEAQRAVNTAQAERDANKARADGQAYAIRAEAEAQAEAIRLKGDAEAKAMKAKADALKANPGLVDYVKAQQWNGQMPQTMLSDGTNLFWTLPQKK